MYIRGEMGRGEGVGCRERKREEEEEDEEEEDVGLVGGSLYTGREKQQRGVLKVEEDKGIHSQRQRTSELAPHIHASLAVRRILVGGM